MSAFWRHLRIWLVAVAAGVAVVLASSAWAGDDDPSGTFLTVFPDNDVYQVSVFGDDFAQGLLNGLVQAFNGDARLNIQRQAVPIAGVTMPDFDGKVTALEKTIGAQPLNIAVVMLGQDDRFMSLRGADGKRLPLGSEAWLIEYTRRVDRLMRTFKAKNAAVYWVGLPILGRTDANELAQRMNDVMRERAYLNGYKYIDSYQGFTDDNGGLFGLWPGSRRRDARSEASRRRQFHRRGQQEARAFRREGTEARSPSGQSQSQYSIAWRGSRAGKDQPR